jgi:hypothetical protein
MSPFARAKIITQFQATTVRPNRLPTAKRRAVRFEPGRPHAPRGKSTSLPGIMGSELSAVYGGKQTQVRNLRQIYSTARPLSQQGNHRRFEKVAIGSHNLSLDGATDNRDATLIVDDEEVAGYYDLPV